MNATELAAELERLSNEQDDIAQKHGDDSTAGEAVGLQWASDLVRIHLCTPNPMHDAAPDMMAALEAAIHEVTHLSPEREDGSHRCYFQLGVLTQMRAAHARAKGTPDA